MTTSARMRNAPRLTIEGTAPSVVSQLPKMREPATKARARFPGLILPYGKFSVLLASPYETGIFPKSASTKLACRWRMPGHVFPIFTQHMENFSYF